ncbi:hypothetical protein DFJ73DRAFT_665208 [Zopfochytrium polystomum]|nr:hypothetical protein DFJ73DRAFT_665208 [Zopfochytrium polystomum]
MVWGPALPTTPAPSSSAGPPPPPPPPPGASSSSSLLPQETSAGQQSTPSSSSSAATTADLQLYNLNNAPSSSSLPVWRIVLLASALCGIQFAWSVIQSYGTPYLLSLGMPKPLMALVWLAGPVSGLVVQPIVGVYSDVCRLSWGRRKPFIIAGGALMVSAILPIAYSRELAGLLSSDASRVQNITIALAVIGFVVLDFSINAVMTASRALMVDAVPLRQQNDAFVWASRMAGFGNCIGYFTGFVNLTAIFDGIASRYPALFGSQLKILCAVCNSCLIISLSLAVLSVRDHPAPETTVQGSRHRSPLRQCLSPLIVIFNALRRLPRPLQSICNVQFFGWLGWFPFLFYASSWVGSRLPPSPKPLDDATEAARAGAFALLLNSILSLLATMLIPLGLSKAKGVMGLKFPYMDLWNRIFSISGVWTLSLLMFGGLMLLTLGKPGLAGATAIVALCGIPWGVTQWVPFSLVAEYVTFYTSGGTDDDLVLPRQQYSAVSITDDDTRMLAVDDRSPLGSIGASPQYRHLDAGVVLGILNIYVVMPQFVSTLLTSLLFSALEAVGPGVEPGEGGGDRNGGLYDPKDSFGWCLRLGIVPSAVAAYVCWKYVRQVPPTGANM